MILFCFLLLIFYVFGISKLSKEFVFLLRNQKLNTKILFLIGLLLPGIILLYVLNGEKQIYYYDYANYWVKTIDYQKFLETDGFDVFRKVYKSINTLQYNDLATVPIAALSKILGLEFRFYIFSIYLIYAVPASILFGNLMLNFSKTKSKYFLITPILFLLFVPLIFPIRYGFVGVAGLVVMGIILNLFFKYKFWLKIDIKTFVLIGIMLMLLLFTRRWYTFWVISFFLINFLLLIPICVKEKSITPLVKGGTNLGIAGSVCGLVMLIFFYPFIELTFLTDYQDIYSGFRARSLKGHLNGFVNTFGYINFILIIIGTIGYIRLKKYYEIAYFLIGTIFLSIFFVTYNDFGPQHYYVIIPFVLLIILGVLFIEVKKYKLLPVSILLAIFSLNFYINLMTDNVKKTGHLFSAINGYKYDRPDYNEINTIVNDIEHHYNVEGQYTYSLTNGGYLNYSMLQNIYLPNKMKATRGLLKSQNVDKRDNFPNDLFLASYVLVGEPALHTLKAKDQQLIVYFNDGILNGNLKNHYKKIKTYYLMDGKKVHLMKKISPFNSNEMNEIKNYFKNLYPDYPNMYDVNPNIALLSTYKKGNAHGEISFLPEGILMHPGGTDSTKVSFSLLSSKENLKLTATFANKDEFTKSWCNPDRDGEITLYIWGDDKLLNQYYVTHKKDEKINLSVKGIRNLTISVDKGKNFDYCDKFMIKNLEIK